MSAAYLADQARRHPALRPRDAIKLCYQAAYGAEHLLPDPAAAREYLRRELNACAADAAEPLYEEISPDLCRVNLRAWKARAYPEDALLALFLQACAPRPDGAARLTALRSEVAALCAQGLLPFELAQWQAELTDYRRQPPHAVHHSEAYRTAEHPCYRLASTAALREWLKGTEETRETVLS